MSGSRPDTFPRQSARTRRFTLGEPRNIVVSADGSRVLFARSESGADPVNRLWILDVDSGAERVLCDPRALPMLDGAGGETDEERRRRERARESAGGVVSFAVDPPCRTVTLALGGQLVIVDVDAGRVRIAGVDAGVFDPRPDPTGRRVAYVRDRALWVLDLADDTETCAATDGTTEVTWGLAEFIAAEEMDRHRGYWWSPGGDLLAACRVDDGAVPVWYIADPASPASEAAAHRYPSAGSENADVGLWILDPTGGRDPVRCDLGEGWEYLCAVNWTSSGLLAMVQTRDQRSVRVLRVDPDTGASRIVVSDEDPAWVELVPGTPTATDTGAVVTCADRDGVRRLCLDGRPVTPPDLQVRAVVWSGDRVMLAANRIDEPRRVNIWEHDPASGETRCVVDGPLVATAVVSGDATTTVVRTATIAAAPETVVHRGGAAITLASRAETPLVEPRVALHRVGERDIETAILAPGSGDGPFPVIFAPYGGPHAQMVVDARNAYLSAQWLADQGFVVVVADGRGTPGRGSQWERAVSGDLATTVLEDQIAVLDALPGLEPRADTGRVAIMGWSFGGYLAALAVLRAPERFHCAVAGAPVCDWSLYDTHYTERYLGTPAGNPDAYLRTSLIADAPRLVRPLLLIHGLADDNVVAAHTLHMSAALLEAGRPHEVLPLSGVTYMTPQETVAENLLLHELAFIRRSLAQPSTA